MTDYWKIHYSSVSRFFDESLLKQVGKTVNGQEVPESQVQMIVQNVANRARLCAKDNTVDLCCGNGLITRQLAPSVMKVLAVDFTAELIKTAKRYNSHPNIEYINADVLRLDQKFFSDVQKVVMYEALQHFSAEQFTKLLDILCGLKSGSLVLLGSIPDHAKLHDYYDTEEKYAFYLKREHEGKPHIGKWWLMEDIKQLACSHGFKAEFIPQDKALYTAHYRFDVLLERRT
jgi:hypothetical protein